MLFQLKCFFCLCAVCMLFHLNLCATTPNTGKARHQTTQNKIVFPKAKPETSVRKTPSGTSEILTTYPNGTQIVSSENLDKTVSIHGSRRLADGTLSSTSGIFEKKDGSISTLQTPEGLYTFSHISDGRIVVTFPDGSEVNYNEQELVGSTGIESVPFPCLGLSMAIIASKLTI